MHIASDLLNALSPYPHTLVPGTAPVRLGRVAASPAPDALAWLRVLPDDIAALTGVVVLPRGPVQPCPATLVQTDNPRLLFARLAWRLFSPPMPLIEPPHYYGRGGIGAAGFGFVRNETGRVERFPHYGGVVIGADVELGHFVCIDRGALTDTVIGQGVKIDNLCHIAHGAVIGAHTTIAALSCIEGSVKIGERCTIGSKVVFQIGSGCGDDVTVGSGSVVTKWIPDGQTWIGNPAHPIDRKAK